MRDAPCEGIPSISADVSAHAVAAAIAAVAPLRTSAAAIRLSRSRAEIVAALTRPPTIRPGARA